MDLENVEEIVGWVYEEMMGVCWEMREIGKGVGGVGGVLYVGVRVWE